MTDSIEQFKNALQGDVVVRGVERRGGLPTADIIASRHWFDARRREIASSGGRPTNPRWTIKRQVPLSPMTWDRLTKISELSRGSGRLISPAQVAAFLLETAISVATKSFESWESQDNDLAGNESVITDETYRTWRQPAPFSAAA